MENRKSHSISVQADLTTKQFLHKQVILRQKNFTVLLKAMSINIMVKFQVLNLIFATKNMVHIALAHG
ncbi:MAG: hypothetical protein Q8J84_09625 [Flavobacteriaceae bacterium]|nr:hypothetical protein [Flavobacteriaceae bacterium]